MKDKDPPSNQYPRTRVRVGALWCTVACAVVPLAALAHDAPRMHDLVHYTIGALVIVQVLLTIGLILQERRRRTSAQDAERMQADMVHAARLAIAGEITASIAHEITQPLSAILSNVETAELLLSHPESNAAAIADILADVKRDDLRANEIVQRLCTLLRKRELRFERVDIGAVVDAVVALIKPDAVRRAVVVRLDVEHELPTVDADPVQLQQVLLNLMLNAMDAMVTTPPARRYLDVRVRRALDCAIEVTLTDTGIGMTKDQLARAFDAFFTTKATGMGLGLSIARSIVHTHGGTLWAERASTGGTTFRFRIPAADKHSAHPALRAIK
jgi:signal transduction histidine kinase